MSAPGWISTPVAKRAIACMNRGRTGSPAARRKWEILYESRAQKPA